MLGGTGISVILMAWVYVVTIVIGYYHQVLGFRGRLVAYQLIVGCMLHIQDVQMYMPVG